jgi:hypothetical protein
MQREAPHRALNRARQRSHPAPRGGRTACCSFGMLRDAWPRMRRLINVGFVVLALGLLGWQLQSLDTAQLASTLSRFPAYALAVGAAFSALSYAAYSSFDLLGRRYTRHRLATRQVLALGFVSHAFALNLGAAGVGLRFRAYGQLGVKAATVARLWLVCFVSNWLGFAVLAGLLLALQMSGAPFGLDVSPAALQAIGWALLCLAAGYFAVCAFSRVRAFTLFGQTLRLPSLRFALAQCVLSVLQWSFIAAGLFVLLQEAVPFLTVLGVLLVCATALAVIDVPGGLGVTEAVFIALLGGHLALATLVSALLVYRLVYFAGPLLVAGFAWLGLELRVAAARKPQP